MHFAARLAISMEARLFGQIDHLAIDDVHVALRAHPDIRYTL